MLADSVCFIIPLTRQADKTKAAFIKEGGFFMPGSAPACALISLRESIDNNTPALTSICTCETLVRTADNGS